jgi:hypothetical protein
MFCAEHCFCSTRPTRWAINYRWSPCSAQNTAFASTELMAPSGQHHVLHCPDWGFGREVCDPPDGPSITSGGHVLRGTYICAGGTRIQSRFHARMQRAAMCRYWRCLCSALNTALAPSEPRSQSRFHASKSYARHPQIVDETGKIATNKLHAISR